MTTQEQALEALDEKVTCTFCGYERLSTPDPKCRHCQGAGKHLRYPDLAHVRDFILTSGGEIGRLQKYTLILEADARREYDRAERFARSDDSLRSRVSALEGGLRPFADFTKHISGASPNALCVWAENAFPERAIATASDFRRASALLSKEGKGLGEGEIDEGLAPDQMP